MGAITIGQTGLLFGVPNAETGVVIASIERASQRQRKEVLGNVGDIIAVGYYAPKAVYTMSGAAIFSTGYASGLSGLAASAYPGGVVTLANIFNDAGSGVSGGHVYNEEFTLRLTNEDFIKFSGSFVQYPSITTP